MTLHEALDRVYARGGLTAEYLLLREAIRALTAEQVREIEALARADAAYDNVELIDGFHPAHLKQ